MANTRKVPRASFTVTVVEDSDYIALVSTKPGRLAWGCYTALVIAAKHKRNGGIFREPPHVIASFIHWPAREIVAAVGLIAKVCRENGNEPWLIEDGRNLVIRRFREWNEHPSWGGDRSKLNGKGNASCSQLGDAPSPSPSPAAEAAAALPAAEPSWEDESAAYELDQAGIGSPVREELLRAGITARQVRAVVGAASARGLKGGAIVQNLRAELRRGPAREDTFVKSKKLSRKGVIEELRAQKWEPPP